MSVFRSPIALFRALTVVALLVGFTLPGAIWLTSEDQVISASENRPLATTPAWPKRLDALHPWREAFTAAFSDQVGLRKPMSRLHGALHYLIGASPDPRVLVGRGRSLFLHVDGIPGLKGEPMLTNSQRRGFKERMLQRGQVIAAADVPYLLVVIPEKSTVQPEQLPLLARGNGTSPRVDALLGAFPTGDRMTALDLRPALLDARDEGPLYFETDAHWNLLGADVAQHAIAEALRDHLPTLEPLRHGVGAFERITPREAGGLAHMLALGHALSEPAFFRLPDPHRTCPQGGERLRFQQRGNCETLRRDCQRHPIDNPHDLGEHLGVPGMQAFELVCPGAPVDATVVVFRDSFFAEPMPLFSAYFTRTAYIWTEASPPLLRYFIEKFDPDVVLEARAERNLVRLAAPIRRR